MAAGLIITIRETVRNALNRPLSGYLEPDGYDDSPKSLEWTAALYAAHPEERKKSVRRVSHYASFSWLSDSDSSS